MKKLVKILMTLSLLVVLSLFVFYKITTNDLVTKLGRFCILQVGSGSMEPTLLVEDIIICKECDEYNVNDIITYRVDNHYLITHRIVEKKENGFVTRGDNNNTIDSQIVTKDEIEGKVIYNSKLLKWIKYNWIIVVIIIFLILLI